MAGFGEFASVVAKAFSINRADPRISFSGVNGQIDMKSLPGSLAGSGALRVAAVWIAATIIADEVGTLKTKLVRRDDTNRLPLRPPELAALWDAPNPDDNTLTWKTTNALSLAMHGVVYNRLEWTRGGTLGMVWPIPPQGVRLERIEGDGGLRLVAPNHEPLQNRYKQRPEFMYIPQFKLPGQIQPLSPVQYAAELLGLSHAYQQTAARLMSEGLKPSAILTIDADLELEEAQAQSEAISGAHGGSSKSGGVIVVAGKDAKLQPWGMTMVDAEMLAGSTAVFDIIMALWRVPPTVAGMVNKPSTWGTGIAEFARGLERFTLRPYVERLQLGAEQFVTKWTRGFEDVQVRYPFDSLLSASPKERNEINRSRLMNGSTSIERILAQYDEPPFDESETRFTQLSLATEPDRRLKRLGEAATAAALLITAGMDEERAWQAVGLDVALADPNLG